MPDAQTSGDSGKPGAAIRRLISSGDSSRGGGGFRGGGLFFRRATSCSYRLVHLRAAGGDTSAVLLALRNLQHNDVIALLAADIARPSFHHRTAAIEQI